VSQSDPGGVVGLLSPGAAGGQGWGRWLQGQQGRGAGRGAAAA